jgi:hypothetical protein
MCAEAIGCGRVVLKRTYMASIGESGGSPVVAAAHGAFDVPSTSKQGRQPAIY